MLFTSVIFSPNIFKFVIFFIYIFFLNFYCPYVCHSVRECVNIEISVSITLGPAKLQLSRLIFRYCQLTVFWCYNVPEGGASSL